MFTPVHERIMQKVDVDLETGCWVWNGGHSHGYGLIQIGSRSDGTRRTVRVHRVMYEHHVGTITEGHQIDHLCRVTRCCNPEHLEVVTPKENSKRWSATITHCLHGHEYTEENTYRYPDGRRRCRTCSREEMRERRRRLHG